MPAKTSATNDASGKVVFDAITYTKAGTYTYTISEVSANKSGYTYDAHDVTVTVKIVDDGAGKLVVDDISYDGETTFKNTYKATDGNVTLTAQKQLENKTLTEGQYSFELVDENSEVVQTVKNNASGAVQFDLTFDQSIFDDEADDQADEADDAEAEGTDEADTDADAEGTDENATTENGDETGENNAAAETGDTTAPETNGDENATAPENNGEAEGNGDETNGEAEGTATEDNGDVPPMATVIVADEAEAEAEADADADADATEVEVIATDTVETETDAVEAEESVFEVIADAVKDIAGFFRLSILNPTVAKADPVVRTKTLTYTIREVKGDDAKTTYATNEVKYTVTVTDNGEGKIIAEAKAEGDTTFVNTYNPDTVDINVSKVWDDKNDKDGIRPESVTVDLMASLPFMDEPAFTGLSLTLNEANGWKGTFEDIVAESDGTPIEFSIEERSVSGYTVAITGSADEGFTVTNIHEVTPGAVLIDPPIEKIVTGDKPETAGTFKFQMKAITEGAPMPEGTVDGVKTVEVQGPGSYEFGIAYITEPGTYVYEISEVDTGADGYTYDKNIYTLTVEVTLDEETGDLVKTETYVDQRGEAIESITFTNTYTAPKVPETPKTGDMTPIVAIEAMAGFATALIAGGFVLRRRDEK